MKKTCITGIASLIVVLFCSNSLGQSFNLVAENKEFSQPDLQDGKERQYYIIGLKLSGKITFTWYNSPLYKIVGYDTLTVVVVRPGRENAWYKIFFSRQNLIIAVAVQEIRSDFFWRAELIGFTIGSLKPKKWEHNPDTPDRPDTPSDRYKIVPQDIPLWTAAPPDKAVPFLCLNWEITSASTAAK